MKPEIRNWRDIDTAYLTGILAENEIDVKIAQVEKSPVGTGQIGDCIRFSLDYASDAPNAPKSLVGKFPADAEDSRKAGVEFGIYNREVKFYQLLQPEARIATPKCYWADIDEETQNFVLLMSDEAPAVQGDQLKGISLSETKTVIREAAKLHSSFWMNPALDDMTWLENTPQAKAAFDPENLQNMWAAFLDRFDDRVSARARSLGTAFCSDLPKYFDMKSERQCLIHVDFRPDNMLFATHEGGKPLSIVDWQSVSIGPAATDVGYCIAGALEPEIRRNHEAELLELYASELDRLGAGTYDSDQLITHYVLGAYQLFMTAFHSSMFVERTERGDDMFMKMLNGAVDLIHDHQAEEWFA